MGQNYGIDLSQAFFKGYTVINCKDFISSVHRVFQKYLLLKVVLKIVIQVHCVLKCEKVYVSRRRYFVKTKKLEQFKNCLISAPKYCKQS